MLVVVPAIRLPQRSRAFASLAFSLGLAACAAAPSPAGLAMGWVTADVEHPRDVTEAPSDAPAFCSPCHGPAATLLFGVARSRFGFIAVGAQMPPPHPAAWTSSDGTRWTRVTSLPAPEGSLALAVADGELRTVIVGTEPAGAISWASTDGVTWTRSPASADLAGPLGATRMTAVVAWRGGFIAGGFNDDPAHNTRTAAIWRSGDGLLWRRISGGPVFQGGHVLGLAGTADTLVAVGTTRDETTGPAAAWVSHDGETWTRLASQALGAGVMRAVTAGGPGFVAVGEAIHDDRAMAWVSRDGTDWQVAPDDPALAAYTLPIRMHAVTAAAGGLVAVGWKSDGGNGSAVAWSSADGRAWRRAPDLASFSGAEMTGVAAVGSLLVGVGTAGYPDNDIASIWLSRP